MKRRKWRELCWWLCGSVFIICIWHFKLLRALGASLGLCLLQRMVAEHIQWVPSYFVLPLCCALCCKVSVSRSNLKMLLTGMFLFCLFEKSVTSCSLVVALVGWWSREFWIILLQYIHMQNFRKHGPECACSSIVITGHTSKTTRKWSSLARG